jgi:hypothetical protein
MSSFKAVIAADLPLLSFLFFPFCLSPRPCEFKMDDNLFKQLMAILDPDASRIDGSDFQRRSSRPKKVPSRFIEESIQVKPLHKVSNEVNASYLPTVPIGTIPSKRTGHWPDQTEGNPEERRLSEDAYSVSQLAPRKRAKSQFAEDYKEATGCEDQDQHQNASRASGSEERLCSAIDVVASPLDGTTLNAAIKAKEAGLLAAVYDVHSIRRIGERWLVRKKCDA